jgi:hypothetical protein
MVTFKLYHYDMVLKRKVITVLSCERKRATAREATVRHWRYVHAAVPWCEATIISFTGPKKGRIPYVFAADLQFVKQMCLPFCQRDRPPFCQRHVFHFVKETRLSFCQIDVSSIFIKEIVLHFVKDTSSILSKKHVFHFVK